MKNICFCNSTAFWGGGEKLFFDYALRFKQKGYNVFVACHPGSKLEKVSLENGLHVHPLKVSNFSFLFPNRIKELKLFFIDKKIDTAFFITSEDVKLGAKAAHKAGVKRVVYLRGLAVKIKNSWINNRVFSKYVTHFIANSNETKNLATQAFTNPKILNKTHVIYHGIDLEQFNNNIANSTFKIKREKDQLIIGNAGRLTTQKGQKLLIKVAQALLLKSVNFKIVIAGTGNLEQQLKNDIKKHKLEKNIELLGFVDDIPGFMNNIDVFALSSIWEGFGFVIAEAMAAKKPVIAFDLTSNPEIITQNKTGFLVAYPDTDAFAEKIEYLAKNPDQLKQMGVAGRQSVQDRFEINAIHAQLEDYLKDEN